MIANPHPNPEDLAFPEFAEPVRLVPVSAEAKRLPPSTLLEVPIRPQDLTEGAAVPASEEALPPSTALLRLNQLIERRLEIARIGLGELHRFLRLGQDGDVAAALNAVREELAMLQQRVQREVGKTTLQQLALGSTESVSPATSPTN